MVKDLHCHGHVTGYDKHAIFVALYVTFSFIHV